MSRRNSSPIRASEDRALRVRVVAEHVLEGVGAGSALLEIGDRLLAVHDDAFRVSWIDLPSLAITPLVLAADGAALPKVSKPDFEAAVHLADEDAVILLGSGSTAARCVVARLDLRTGAIAFAARDDIYRCVVDALELDTRANVEGAAIDRERLRLFHRGVGGAPSGCVELAVDVLFGEPARASGARYVVDLGSLDGVALGITDAATVSARRTVFVAAAEDTVDAFADGTVTGSVVGLIEEERAVRWTRLLDSRGEPLRAKVEGIVVDEGLTGGWVLTDADDAASPTTLCRIELAGAWSR